MSLECTIFLDRQPILRIFASLWFCALFAFAWINPAQAQSQHASDVRIAILEPLSITKVNDMDFGRIIGDVSGTIVMTATASPTCTASAGLIQSGVCQPAEFGGAGPNNQRIRIRRPAGDTINLTGPGADMTITDFSFDGSPDLTLVQTNPQWTRYRIASADGTFIFRVGGTLNVGANQAPGVYNGTFNIRLDYQ